MVHNKLDICLLFSVNVLSFSQFMLLFNSFSTFPLIQYLSIDAPSIFAYHNHMTANRNACLRDKYIDFDLKRFGKK